jgi:hypothetical protein
MQQQPTSKKETPINDRTTKKNFSKREKGESE